MKIRIALAVMVLNLALLPLAATASSNDTSQAAAARQHELAAAQRQAELAERQADLKSKAHDLAQTREQLDELRQRMNEMAKRLAELSRKVGEPAPQALAWHYLSDPDVGTLGLVLMPKDDALEVVAVTPGGAAEKSGIVAGDRIVSIDGKPTGGGDIPVMGDVNKFKAGQTYTFDIRHNGKHKTVKVVPERRTMPAWTSLLDETRAWHDKDMPDIDIQRIVREANEGARQARIALRSFSPWWGLNLVSLNKDLGSYFGTDKGALLLSSDGDSLPGLKAGDVITKIGATSIDRPEDAMRALREHAGDKVQASIMRHGKRLQLALQLPEHPFALPPAPPKPPAAPTAPKPPTPPTPPAPPNPDHKTAP